MLLLLVDPACPMCRTSNDLFERVRAGAKANGIKVFAVSFGGKSSKEDFFSYARDFSDSEHVFYWDGDKKLISPALQQMVIPSFLLLNDRGVVLRRFPGGSKEPAIKSKMAEQILTETFQEKARLP